MAPGEPMAYAGTPLGGGRAVSVGTARLVSPASLQPGGGSTYLSASTHHGGGGSGGSFGAAPLREQLGAPVVVSRLVSQSSVGSMRNFPQVVSGISSGHSLAPDAYAVTSSSGAVADQTPAKARVVPLQPTDSGTDLIKAPVWSRSPLGPAPAATAPASTDDALQREAESLRRTVAMQENRIESLSQELRASSENEGRLSEELQQVRAEVARLGAELQQERVAREQAEASLLQQQAPLQQALTPTASAAGFTKRGATGKLDGSRQTNASRRAKEAAAERRAAYEAAAAAAVAVEDSPSQRHAARSPSPAGAGRKAQQPSASRPISAKDDIDSRLQDFVARSQCALSFRRLNRGFYAFRRMDESPSQDRSVEISIVNGKLMVRLEPSTHDPGWNNGKPGPIERFVAKFAGE